MRPLIILGAGGLAREIAMLAQQTEAPRKVDGFIGGPDHNASVAYVAGAVWGNDEWFLNENFEADIVVAIGYPTVRAQVVASYLVCAGRFEFPTLIHRNVCVDTTVNLGRGTVIAAGAILTCDIRIGEFCLINYNATVGHDVRMGNFNVINPGANISGGVQIENQVLIGTGAQILQGVTIGSQAIVGAGAVVTKDVPAGSVVVGVPAEPLRRRSIE